MARCAPQGGGSGNGAEPKKEPIKAAQYVCEGPEWDEVENGQRVHKTSGPHNKVPGSLGTTCVCDNPDFAPVAVHGTGKQTRSDEAMVVTQYTIMCIPKDSKRYEALFTRIEQRLTSLETSQADDEEFKKFVRRDLKEHGTTLIDHGNRIRVLEGRVDKVEGRVTALECDVNGGPACPGPGLKSQVNKPVGLGLNAGVFLLATPGGRMAGGMAGAFARFQPDKVGVEGEIRTFYTHESLTSDTSYRGDGRASIMGGGAATHLTLSPFDDRNIRLLLGTGVSVMSRTFKGPHDEARQGVTVNIVELGADLPLGGGVNLRPIVAPTYGWYGKSDGVKDGFGIFAGAGIGFAW